MTPTEPMKTYVGIAKSERRLAHSAEVHEDDEDDQKSFSLTSALQQARSFSYSIEENKEENDLTPIISQFVQSIHKH